MKPERLTSVPPGCQMVLGNEFTDDDFVLMADCTTQARGVYVQGRGRLTPHNWPVLRHSADNCYGKLPWEITIPEGWEPDGAWELKPGESLAYRIPPAGTKFVDLDGAIRVGMNMCRPMLCVRRIKTKRMVLEVEFPYPPGNQYLVGEEVSIYAGSGLNSRSSHGMRITAVWEVER